MGSLSTVVFLGLVIGFVCIATGCSVADQQASAIGNNGETSRLASGQPQLPFLASFGDRLTKAQQFLQDAHSRLHQNLLQPGQQQQQQQQQEQQQSPQTTASTAPNAQHQQANGEQSSQQLSGSQSRGPLTLAGLTNGLRGLAQQQTIFRPKD